MKTPIRVAIVEDDVTVQELLKGYFERFQKETGQLFSLALFDNGEAFLKDYRPSFDLVLMDIEMPGIDGMETAKRLRSIDKNVVLIFVTNLAQYALKGYEVEAVDFAVKPLAYEDFVLKIKKGIRYIKRETSFLITTTTGEKVTLKTSELYYVEVQRHYLLFYCSSGEYTCRGALKEFEGMLTAYGFRKCNNCYLVNLAEVKAIDKDKVIVGPHTLFISRRKKAEFLEEFTKFMGGF